MRFKIDENLPVEAAQLLNAAGHEAATIHDQHMVGQPDPNVASVCLDETRALVTLDLDFSDIRTYPPRPVPWTDCLASQKTGEAIRACLAPGNRRSPADARIRGQMSVDCGRTRCSDSRGRFSQWSITREAVRRCRGRRLQGGDLGAPAAGTSGADGVRRRLLASGAVRRTDAARVRSNHWCSSRTVRAASANAALPTWSPTSSRAACW
jgi:hypothetical protein